MTPASVTYCRNPFYPSLDRRTVAVRRRRRVRALAPGWHTPYVALLNGRPILRAEWRRKVGAGDTLAFVALPMGGGGGGGKNPLMTIASLAIMVFNPGLALAGEMGFSGLGATLMGGAINMGIGALFNAAMGGTSPSLPSTQTATELAAPSPTYSLRAQGNSARLEQPIPAWYGYHCIYPDFAADPYVEFHGNEQYVYQLLLVTQGWFDIATIRIEDTPLASFEDITTEIVNPGGAVTLFPSAVTTSIEVSGQELIYDTILGPFVANAAGTLGNAIGIDLIAPRGLYYANNSGGLDSKSITVLVEARAINDSGTAIGSWATLGTETLTGATTTPQRESYRYTVTAGRYEVRATRTSVKDTDTRAGHDILWGGLRTYLPGSQSYGDVTLVAMRMKASNQLSAQASRRVNVLGTRMLPMWDAIGGWSAVTATRSIAWAAADICRSAYGGALPDSAIDLAGLAALDAVWTSRGDEFNGGYDQRVTFWEALTKVCRAGRTKPYIQGGIVRFARDGAASLPVAMFTPRNIVSGSFRTEYLLPSDDRADAVTATFVDAATWMPTPVSCVLVGGTSTKPAKIDLFGVTDHAQAWREGIYEAACNRYRTRLHTFETEMEGFILSPLDLIAISRDRPTWGQSGEILSYTALTVGGILELSEPVTFTTGNHYLAARKRNGGLTGPWRVTVGADAFHVVLAEAMTGFTPDTGLDRERTAYSFGAGTAYTKLARVLPDGIRVKSMNRVEIACVAEDDRVHAADGETVPSEIVGWTLPTAPTVPAVTGLIVMQGGTPDNPVLAVSWRPAPGATSYLVERSDDGVIWTGVGEYTTTHITIAVLPGTIHLRVAGIGATRGGWATWTDNAGTGVAPPSDVTGLALAESFTGPQLSVKWDAAARASSYTVAIWSGSTLIRYREVTVLSYTYTVADAIADGLEGIGRSLTVKVRATGNGTTSAAWTSLAINNPQIGALSGVAAYGLMASILVEYTPPANTPDFDGVCVWVSTTDGFTPGGGNLAYKGRNNPVSIDLDPSATTYYLRIAGYDAWGADGLTVSAQQTVVMSQIVSTQITDGAISTPKLAANSVTAAKMVAGTITAASGIIADAAITNAKIADVIQSTAYVAGSSGWQIDKAGNIELNAATFRGTLDVRSASSGARLIIKSDVIAVHDGTRVRVKIGNLAASI